MRRSSAERGSLSRYESIADASTDTLPVAGIALRPPAADLFLDLADLAALDHAFFAVGVRDADGVGVAVGIGRSWATDFRVSIRYETRELLCIPKETL